MTSATDTSNGSKIHQILRKVITHLEPHDIPTAPLSDYEENRSLYNTEIEQRLSRYYKDNFGVKIHNISIKDTSGNIVFELLNVEAPTFWSERAVRVCASKYFMHEKEHSVFDMVTRVVKWITLNGLKRLYFENLDNALTFAVKLAGIILYQRATFNSPVWFNLGTHGIDSPEQSNACFVNELNDDIASILAHNVIKQLIAIGGSGSGADLSVLRSETELLSTGGKPSGPSGFFRMFDSNLGAIKSSGKTRRAAGLLSIFHDHPDALKFLTLKRDEERKARVLAEHCEAWEDDFASESIFSHRGLLYQNINVSVRFRKSFWDAYEKDGYFCQVDRHGYKNTDWQYPAREFMAKIAEAAWECGDPGVQFDDNVNDMNPFLKSGRRCYSTNACSELQFLNNSACNLATIRLTAYLNTNEVGWPTFMLEEYDKDIDIMITAMDILIDDSVYPTKAIADTSWKARNIGLNYADLGSLLFKLGLAYGSDARTGRAVAAFLASHLTMRSYRQSNMIAKELVSFEWSKEPLVAEGMFDVMKKHMASAAQLKLFIKDDKFSDDFIDKLFGVNSLENLCDEWNSVINDVFIAPYGIPQCILRNSQVSIMVPTGTVSFMLDCDTTGIESHLSHSFKKDLVGGGSEQFDTDSYQVKAAIRRFDCNRERGYMYGYKAEQGLLKFLATALGNGNPDSTLTPMDHVNMMAAIQPHISLGISKTCNMPTDCTPKDIEEIYYQAWKKGLKAIAIYRNNSKIAQPLTIKEELKTKPVIIPIQTITPNLPKFNKCKVPTLRYAFKVANEKVYLHVGVDPTADVPWEVFVRLSGVGGQLDGSMSTVSILASQLVQHGNVESAVKTLKKMVFEPNGWVTWPDGTCPEEFTSIKQVSSIPNAVGRMLEIINERGVELFGFDSLSHPLITITPIISNLADGGVQTPLPSNKSNDTGRKCEKCGHMMYKSGMSAACYQCDFCFNSVGSCSG